MNWREPTPRRMRTIIYENKNPGVFTKYDALGVECCKETELSGAFVHIASGGSVLAECLACGRHWHFQGVPTHENGPIIGLTATAMPAPLLEPPPGNPGRWEQRKTAPPPGE